MNFRLLGLTLVGLSFACVAGCSSSSSGTSSPTDGGAGTDTGGLSGLIKINCYKATSKKCDIKGESTSAGADSVKASCTSGGGTVVDHCPADSLQGCCLISGLGTCTYDPAQASALQGACGAGGGTWGTSAP